MTVQEQIISLEQALLQAMLSSDVKELDALIADDLIFTNHLGQIIGKAEDIEAHRSGKVSIDTIEPSEQFIRIFKDTAVVSVLMKMEGTYLDQPFRGKNRYLRVWMNGDKGWKIVAGQATSLAG